jgi:hypothetical protein
MTIVINVQKEVGSFVDDPELLLQMRRSSFLLNLNDEATLLQAALAFQVVVQD